jgi:hypothetical protein
LLVDVLLAAEEEALDVGACENEQVVSMQTHVGPSFAANYSVEAHV